MAQQFQAHVNHPAMASIDGYLHELPQSRATRYAPPPAIGRDGHFREIGFARATYSRWQCGSTSAETASVLRCR